MKNRIWKKLSTLSMALIVAGMVIGGSMMNSSMVWGSETSMHEREIDSEMQVDVPVVDVTDESDYDGVAEADNKVITEIDNAKESDETESNVDTDKTETLEEISNEISSSNIDASENTAIDVDESNDYKMSDLNMSVSVDENPIKAGRDLVYSVMIENTGDAMLKNIRINAELDAAGLTGEWSDTDDAVGNIAYLEILEAGSSREVFYTVKIPENQSKSITLKLNAMAEVFTENDEKQETITRELSINTEVTPLVASFEVSKSADRTVAVPGDKITFTICIRNTGERTLHSVITTEKFQLGNVSVRFVEQEGVTLNNAMTKARIESITPGESVSLKAVVTLPQSLESQELLNEVSVTSDETGEKVITSEAKIQVKAAETKEIDVDGTDNDNALGGNDSTVSQKVTSNPKTGDPYEPIIWLGVMACSLIFARGIKIYKK